MQVPKGFKLLHDQQIYNGSQEPELWLSDCLQAVKILGGSKVTAMESLQLHLTGAARSWLSKLPDDSIGSWGELESQFTSNFCSTYTRPASIEEVKSCMLEKQRSVVLIYIALEHNKKLSRKCLRRASNTCLRTRSPPFGPR
jgi:hypothetical protein